MQNRNRWQTWLAGFVFVVAGCGQVKAPPATSGAAPAAATSAKQPAAAPAVVEPADAKGRAAAQQPVQHEAQQVEQTAVQPASPASLDQATRVIDLR